MAPLPHSNTDRLYLDYVSGDNVTSQQHTALVRFAGTNDPTTAQEAVADVLEAIGAVNFADGWRVYQVRWGAEGSELTFPVGMVARLVDFTGAGAVLNTFRDQTIEWRFVGRGNTAGRRVTLSLYGLTVARPDDFREEITTDPANWVRNGTLALNAAAASGVFVSIAGDPTLWYGYANWQQNSYWESEFRS